MIEPETPAIKLAWNNINRSDFLPVDQKPLACLDQPLPIGWRQTISQPSVVAFMLEELKPKPGGRYLDIGSGSGWTTALLSHIAGPNGRVWAIELIPELKEFGQNNVGRYGFIKKGTTKFILGDGSLGHPQEAPFDGILVSASAKEIPDKLKKQLKVGGRMVVPVGQSIFRVVRTIDDFEVKEFKGFVFVPLISKHEK